MRARESLPVLSVHQISRRWGVVGLPPGSEIDKLFEIVCIFVGKEARKRELKKVRDHCFAKKKK